MTDLRLLHAAEIHLDSPLLGLARYEGMPVAEIRAATRTTFDHLVAYACQEAVDFVVIAGDLFDGDWHDMSSGLYFARAMGRLEQAGIPAYVLNGNHDAASVLTRSVPCPPNVHRFGSRKPETFRLGHLGVAVHGWSFAQAAAPENLALSYPYATPHAFNVGVLHTSLSGHPGHDRYAPCELTDLRARATPTSSSPATYMAAISARPVPKAPSWSRCTTVRWSAPSTWSSTPSAGRGSPSIVAAARRSRTSTAASGKRCRVRALPMTRAEDSLLALSWTAPPSSQPNSPTANSSCARTSAPSPPPSRPISGWKSYRSKPVCPRPCSRSRLRRTSSDCWRTRKPTRCSRSSQDLVPFLTAAAGDLEDPETDELRGIAQRGDWPQLVATATGALRSRLRGAG